MLFRSLLDSLPNAFVGSRRTMYMFQPAIGSFYEGIQYGHKELLSARDPWSGYIHADGLLKNEEIYNIFDTGKFLNRPPLVAVSNTSGLAGIALWINTYYRLPDDRKVDKNSKLVTMIKEWVDEQYDEGRVTTITDNELVVQITDCCKKLNIVL